MAPEQAAADPAADHRVDLYALGIVGYEMLAGSPPFAHRTPQALLAAHLTELPLPLAARRYDIPAPLAAVLMQCLEKDPADRPRSAADLARILDGPEVLSGPIAETTEATRRRRLRRITSSLPWLAIAVFVAATLAYAFRDELQPSAADSVAPATVPAGVVFIPPATAIGEGAAALARATSSAIESMLVGAGYKVESRQPPGPDGTRLQLTLMRTGTRGRVFVRMSPAGGGAAMWAEQFDFTPETILMTQDTVAARVARAIARSFKRP